MKQYKYKTTFSSLIKIDTNENNFLSQASLDDLRKFIPKIEEKQKEILLPISANCCVAGLCNKNDDAITIEKGLEIYKNFIGTFCDVEHSRNRCLGYICDSNLTEYGTDEKLTESEVKEGKLICNITLSCILWRIVNEEVCKFIEESNNPKSDKFLAASLSWELGFNEYKIVAIKGNSKNIANGKIIDDPKEIEKLEPKLRSFGGTGKIDDNTRIYRIVDGEVLPLGVGIVAHPAGAVKGIAAEEDKNTKETIKSSDNIGKDESISINTLSNSLKEFSVTSTELMNSLSKVKNVSDENAINIEKLNNLLNIEKNGVKTNDKIMKIKSLQDITDESLKEVKASTIVAFVDELVSEKLKEANDKYKSEQDAKGAAVKAAEEAKRSVDELNTKITELNTKYGEIKKQADVLAKEKEDREKLEKFNQRMAKIDETFELSKEQSEVIAKKVKEMADEIYSEYEKELDTLMAASKKSNKKKDNDNDKEDMDEGDEPADDNDEEDQKENKKSKKSAKKSKASVNTATEVVDEAIDNGEKDKETVANSTEGAEQTVKQKYAKAFGVDGFEINVNRK